MNSIVSALVAKNNSTTSCLYRFDSHGRTEYHGNRQITSELYDKPCRWEIERTSSFTPGFEIRQYDLSISSQEKATYGFNSWDSGSGKRLIYEDHMKIVHIAETPQGAKNVYLESTRDGANCLIALVVKDHIEKIQSVDRLNDVFIIYRSSLDKICFLTAEEKKAIFQTAYQMMVSAAGRQLSYHDDPSIDELISGCCYMKHLGDLLWNQATDLNPYEAFRTVAALDSSAKAAVKLVLVNVARMDNSALRFDILRQLCQQASLPD